MNRYPLRGLIVLFSDNALKPIWTFKRYTVHGVTLITTYRFLFYIIYLISPLHHFWLLLYITSGTDILLYTYIDTLTCKFHASQ